MDETDNAKSKIENSTSILPFIGNENSGLDDIIDFSSLHIDAAGEDFEFNR